MNSQEILEKLDRIEDLRVLEDFILPGIGNLQGFREARCMKPVTGFAGPIREP